MRKLFRFKYEPCNGTCYAWCDFLPNELNKLTPAECEKTVAQMVAAHARLCDNPAYSFGVDFDDLFVAHFRTPGSTDLFISNTFADCVDQVCKKVMDTEIPQVDGSCTYGDNGAEDLGREILRACTDEAYRELHHKNCPCHAA